MTDAITPTPDFPSGSVSFLPIRSGDGYNYGGGIIVTFGDRSFQIADADPMKGYRQEDRQLAHLLAAAPDMAAALKRALSWLSSYPGGNAEGAYMDAVNALKKAGCYE